MHGCGCSQNINVFFVAKGFSVVRRKLLLYVTDKVSSWGGGVPPLHLCMMTGMCNSHGL